ncbi:MAG: translocation/assembly module TamB domain-containing protein, partial [Terriglobales bacterium]
TVDVTWRGNPSRAVARFDVAAQPGNGEGALPVTAHARGTYSVGPGRFDFTELEAGGRSMHAVASGSLASSTNVKVSATGSLRDIAEVLRAWTGEEKLPAGLTGDGSFQGTISGTARRPFISGHLDLNNLDVPLPLQLPAPAATVMAPVTAVAPPHPGPGPRVAHYDSASADLQYSPAALDIRNGTVRRGAEQLNIAASIGLVNGNFYDTDPIQASLSAKNFRAEDLLALGGYSLPVTGVVNAVADLHGTKDDPRGTASFQLTDATVNGLPVKSASANIAFVNQEAQFSNVSISEDGARVSGSAQYNLRTTAFRFSMNGTRFRLSEFSQLQGTHVRTTGTLNFDARGSGTQAAPVIDADVNLRDVAVNGQRIADLSGTAKTTRGVMRVQARSSSGLASMEVDGTVVMRNNFDANLTLNVGRLNAGPLLNMALAGRFTGQSEMSGALHLAGPLRQPDLLTVEGNLGEFMVAIENVKVQNEGALRFVIADGVLRLEQFKIAGTDTTLTARGTVDLAGARALDFRADGRINLGLVQSFNSDLHAAGVMDFDMRAAGTMLRPTLFGTVKIEGGTITSINFPTGISALNGTLVFNQDRCQIQQLTGTVGGGAVNFGWFVSYGNGLSFDVTADARDVRLRYPQGFSETVDGNLRLTGTRVISTLSGNLTVVRFNVSPQFDMAVAIAAAKSPPSPPDPTSWLNDLRLNLKVTSAPDLELTTSLAKLAGDMSLNVRGTAIRPAVLGRINITEGQVSFNGATYQIDRGDITFSNPVKIEPVIDVAATTRVRDYDVTLGFHGPIARLSTTYRSEPPLPTADIISLLAFGKTREESEMASAAQPTFSESASNAILGQALNAAVSNRVQRLFGVSRVKIAPDVGGVSSNPNARVTIEQQVSKDFTVTYITDLTRSNQQAIQVEYNYNRNVSIIGARDQYGIISFDVRWRQRKR